MGMAFRLSISNVDIFEPVTEENLPSIARNRVKMRCKDCITGFNVPLRRIIWNSEMADVYNMNKVKERKNVCPECGSDRLETGDFLICDSCDLARPWEDCNTHDHSVICNDCMPGLPYEIKF